MSSNKFKVVALVSVHNEEDVIYHVIGDLVQQGIGVYLLNHCSNDSTVEVATPWLGKGLLHIENFPQDAGYSERNKREYIWSEILKRKQELAHSIEADWFIHHDADEFRESPWFKLSLLEAIRYVDTLGYNAIDFELLNFRPIDNSFVPGTDVRVAMHYYEGAEAGNELQIKAWKKQAQLVDLVSFAGHNVTFDGRKVCPVKFILRHYPVRSQLHGIKKVIQERKLRFNSREIRAFNWHTHYNQVVDEKHNFIYDSSNLKKYDPLEIRMSLLSKCNMSNEYSDDTINNIEKTQSVLESVDVNQYKRRSNIISMKSVIQETFFIIHDCIDMLQKINKVIRALFRRNS